DFLTPKIFRRASAGFDRRHCSALSRYGTSALKPEAAFQTAKPSVSRRLRQLLDETRHEGKRGGTGTD
ncbi:hypothetical protein, partial [Mesorhizobium sp. M7A.F.Ca.AU.001.01.1.1]|uniref:hypothetical protein n=1 Tax=Mesorhizobium sp. M7A.F.Ca.AU.001.01.1.1 TaxID=2496675 RepID=UPI0019D43D08